MGIDLATLLAVMAVVWTGDALSPNPLFSIGGSDVRVTGAVGGLIGTTGPAQGLAKAHNILEADSSPTRNDLYVTGDAATMNLTRFEKLYNLVSTDRAFTMEDMADFAAIRFRESIEENKDFYFGPFTGTVARNAGFCFVGRLLANHSDGGAGGTLTHGILKSFYAVTGDDPSSFTYKRGWERIPENWYGGSGGYGVAEISLDIVSMVVRHPELASIGGNTGTVNSFTGVDLSDPVTGLANIPSLLKSNNLMCFALELVKGAVPSTANSLFTTLAEPLTKLFDAVDAPLLSLACPAWRSVTEGGQSFLKRLQATYPGAKRGGL
ncbi:hypothetical protein TI39_contig311g00030 [Zymoseptoria brevis]|uniref:Heme haloperoxidase family profile domain-containing protein n=1 Tax=Zymoseptoria brevis TaxID=1047168 RepID=A0A0F4GU99_9PEZI|nr:hypothetical protein TI39_contig311g00030 [Zymoseptoria brevis]